MDTLHEVGRQLVLEGSGRSLVFSLLASLQACGELDANVVPQSIVMLRVQLCLQVLETLQMIMQRNWLLSVHTDPLRLDAAHDGLARSQHFLGVAEKLVALFRGELRDGRLDAPGNRR